MASTLVSPSPDGGRLIAPDGGPFFAVIVNYVGHSDRAWAQFQPAQFDPALIEADFRLARATGANTIRTFVAAPLQNEIPGRQLDQAGRPGRGRGARRGLPAVDAGRLQPELCQNSGCARRADRRPLCGPARYPGLRPQERAALLSPRADALSGGQPALRAGAERNLSRPTAPPEEALAWATSEGKAPTSLSEAEAVTYANISEILEGLLKATSDWISARSYTVSAVDFIRSPAGRAVAAFYRQAQRGARRLARPTGGCDPRR